MSRLLFIAIALITTLGCGDSPGVESQYGELVECDDIERPSPTIETFTKVIQTEPGDVVTVTICGEKHYIDGELVWSYPDRDENGCRSHNGLADENYEVRILCGETIETFGGPDSGMTFEAVWDAVYVRVEGAQ